MQQNFCQQILQKNSSLLSACFYSDVRVSLNENTCSRIIQENFNTQICSKPIKTDLDKSLSKYNNFQEWALILGFIFGGILADSSGRKFSAFIFLLKAIISSICLLFSESVTLIFISNFVRIYSLAGMLVCFVILIIECC